MKKKYVFIIIAMVVVIAIIALYFFFKFSVICTDKGGSRIYFEKNYYLTHLSEFSNKSGISVTIPEGEVVAKFSESADCYDKGSYFVKKNGVLAKVNKEAFNNFINNYPSNSLLVQKRFFGLSGIFEVSSDKLICNTYSIMFDRSVINDPNCINITKSN